MEPSHWPMDMHASMHRHRTPAAAVAEQAGFYFRNPVFQEYVDTPWSQFRAGGNARLPPHVRMLLDADVVRCLAGCHDAVARAGAVDAVVSGCSSPPGAAGREPPAGAGCKQDVKDTAGSSHNSEGSGQAGGPRDQECTCLHAAAPNAEQAGQPFQRPGGSEVKDSRCQGVSWDQVQASSPVQAHALAQAAEVVGAALDRAARLRWTQAALEVCAQACMLRHAGRCCVASHVRIR